MKYDLQINYTHGIGYYTCEADSREQAIAKAMDASPYEIDYAPYDDSGDIETISLDGDDIYVSPSCALEMAAPDLLEALEKLAVTYADYRSKAEPDFDPMVNSRCLAEARAAIAKARS